MLESFKDKFSALSFKDKKVYIPVIITLLIVIGVSAKLIMNKVAESKIDFYSVMYDGAKVASSVGYYRYSVELQSGDLNVDKGLTSAKDEIKSSESSDSSSIEGKSVLDSGVVDSGKMSDSWTSANGEKINSKGAGNYSKFVFTGFTEKVQPLTTKGSVLYYKDVNAKSGIEIFNYSVVEGVWYINLGESKKALLNSGDTDLIRIGNALPDISGNIKLDKDELTVDNYFNKDDIESIQDVDYSIKRREFLRICSTALETLKSSLVNVKPSVVTKEDNRYYFNIDSSNLSQVVEGVSSIGDKLDSSYTSYENKLKANKDLDDDHLSLVESGKDNFLSATKPVFDKFNSLDLQGKDLQSVNWIRLSGVDGKKVFELSSTSTWQDTDGTKYLLTIQGQHYQKSPKEYKVTAPTSFMTYKQTKRTSATLVLSELINDAKDLMSSNKILEESKIARTDNKAKK